MAERSFRKEVQQLRIGKGEVFRGEGILAITKALLENGVGYVSGYQGAPISHLMDVLADAEDILGELGVRFESSASEATAAASLAASVHYPIRGAVTFKSTVGTNVASDALANLASGGVTGGALIIVGEDYGEGSSIMQERSHAFAMKSQIWLLDPRPNLPSITAAVGHGFALSEASNTPVMLEVRIRSCHVHGSFVAADNKRPDFTVQDALDNPQRDTARVVLPPASYVHEREKYEKRLPAAIDYIVSNGLNEFFGPASGRIGIVLQGGMYNGVIRALQRLGLADLYGDSAIPLYVLNVTYPLVPDQFLDFCRDKDHVLIIEEGQPDFIEESLRATLHRAGMPIAVSGKDVLPMAGEYTGAVMLEGLTAFLSKAAPQMLTDSHRAPNQPDADPEMPDLSATVPPRPPGFCTGCPERPIFAALKMAEQDHGAFQVAGDIGCHLFGSLAPFNIGGTTMGYGLGPASNSAFHGGDGTNRPISILGDGGFWHNGLNSSIGNAVYNKGDGITVIIDNYYSAATGGQDLLSSRADNADALTTTYSGPKVIVASSECMLNRQRREKPQMKKAVADGRRMIKPKFGVDEDVCTGDHACMRLSGCPSLTLKTLDDPLRDDPVAHIDQSCVGCGNCGEVADAAVLCPSFYQADLVYNPGAGERMMARVRRRIIAWFQTRRAARRLQFEPAA